MKPEDLTCGSSLSKIFFAVLVSVTGLSILILSVFCAVRRWRRRKRERRAARGDTGGNYTAVYTREQDEATVSIPDNNRLLENGNETEFDV